MWRSGFFYNLDVADILSSDAEALLFTFEPDRSINRESVGKEFTLTPQQHGRTSDTFTYRLMMKKSDGSFSGTTWGVLESSVDYDSTTGNITITCPDGGYAGKIVFTG